MPYTSKQARFRPAACCCRPAHQVRPCTKQHDHLSISPHTLLDSPVNPPPLGSPRKQCCRGSHEAGFTAPPDDVRLVLTRPIGRPLPGERGGGQSRSRARRLTQVDGPERAFNPGQILWVGDFFVPEEFGPRSIRGVGEAMDGPLARAVPPAFRLASGLP